jgi:hypothetical protein
VGIPAVIKGWAADNKIILTRYLKNTKNKETNGFYKIYTQKREIPERHAGIIEDD